MKLKHKDHFSLSNNNEIWPDFDKVGRDLIKHKILYLIGVPFAFLISLLYTYSLPNYYESTIRLAPELPSKYVGLGSLFEMVKFMDLDAMSGRAENDFAMYPRKFPIIMNNIEFQTTLFSIKVKRESDGKEFYYYDYLLREQKKTWWKKGFQKISTLLTRKETIIPKPYDPKTVSSFKLNEAQIKVADAISSKVHVKVDPYDMVVSISVTDQDPLIAATVADSVKAHLQTFLIKYQTRKAQADLDYGKIIFKKVKSDYIKASQNYSEYADANRDIITEKAKLQLSFLENEMLMKYNYYEQVTSNLINAEMDVQKETPSFTILQSASVPLEEMGPERLRTCFLFTFFVFYSITLWILKKENDVKPFFGMK